MDESLYARVYDALLTCDVESKVAMAKSTYADWCVGKLHLQDDVPVKKLEQVGRPEKPELVPPAKVKRRSLHNDAGRAALVHAVTHIEFNAINLALDAVYRFRDMPDDYRTDWLQVAAEEAYHFELLSKRLQTLGYMYGDMPAHNGLWEQAVKTDFDVMVRMALVPRVLEARGLDVTPGMMERLEQAGDSETVDILKVILRDEIGHVKIGSRWFRYCCELRSLQPEETFRQLLQEYMKAPLRGPFYNEARLQAGFTQEELDELVKLEENWVEEIKA